MVELKDAEEAGNAIIRAMADREPQRQPVPVRSALSSTPAATEPKALCERCGAEVYRMHAVWRCPACGFKSDCCGW